MFAITWVNEAYQHLLEGRYDQVATFYERLLEQEPEIVEHYWYLGLAYLLLGQEEQAQLTWFVVLGQCEVDEGALQTHVLCQILETEAERQETGNNYQLAWLIRGHIRELAPDNYDNLFHFICLDILISDSKIDQLQSWNFSELLASIPVHQVKEKTLIQSLTLIARIPCWDSLDFIRYSLTSTEKNQVMLAIIADAANQLLYKADYANYVVHLLKVCLKFDPQNLSIINTIFGLYRQYQDIDSLVEFAKIFLERSRTLTEKLFGSAQLVATLLKSSNWQEVLIATDQYFQYLLEFQFYAIETEQIFIQNSFILTNQPLLYLQDNPQQNRQLANYISKIFQEKFRANTNIKILPFSNEINHSRPLRVGYIGSTLDAHPVGYLARWLIYHSDREMIKNYAYLFLTEKDSFSEEWFVNRMESYRLLSKDIQAAVQQIQADQIDILVDLDSWTVDLTCQVMALKPAPIQVTWLGFDASGIPNVDYFIADPYVLPANADQYYSEKIWRLPNCYLGIDGFEIGVPTLRREDLGIENDAIIFINFQNAVKRHPHIIHQQMKILKAVPHSYLLVKGTGKADEIQKLFESIAQEEGLPLDHLRFLEPCATEMEHRANLMIGDVVLDTYPYNGATTTLEVLWAGIPLVTRVGEQFAARNSYTFMVNAGITEGIAWNDEEYVEWGIKLGTDKNLRKEVSWKLKQSKKISPLWNGKQFSHEMENAYQQMWEIYVKENC
ncbi:MAG: O-linked N-acetylglucosamine transferase, SPINDLY family protein [Snowella sp.]|nr:MAG: O-linked N-acetylglucosamine transferase, SPINDLY family protein [Snowella sp.]